MRFVVEVVELMSDAPAVRAATDDIWLAFRTAPPVPHNERIHGSDAISTRTGHRGLCVSSVCQCELVRHFHASVPPGNRTPTPCGGVTLDWVVLYK